jgi:hypothetical protein
MISEAWERIQHRCLVPQWDWVTRGVTVVKIFRGLWITTRRKVDESFKHCKLNFFS